MDVVGNPKTWVPYMRTKDCSQKFCSIYCSQWCQPQPQPASVGSSPESGYKISPIFITIISVLACGLLLLTYFAMISKYCRTKSAQRSRGRNHDEELQDVGISPFPQFLNHATVGGLDENFIESIGICKYKKSESLVESMDCCVCLGEFQENESVRILPKCSHSFHLPCIDMWLKSHSTCPLCRASLTHPVN